MRTISRSELKQKEPGRFRVHEKLMTSRVDKGTLALAEEWFRVLGTCPDLEAVPKQRVVLKTWLENDGYVWATATNHPSEMDVLIGTPRVLDLD